MKEIFKLIKSDYKRYSGNSNIFYGGGGYGMPYRQKTSVLPIPFGYGLHHQGT